MTTIHSLRQLYEIHQVATIIADGKILTFIDEKKDRPAATETVSKKVL